MRTGRPARMQFVVQQGVCATLSLCDNDTTAQKGHTQLSSASSLAVSPLFQLIDLGPTIMSLAVVAFDSDTARVYYQTLVPTPPLSHCHHHCTASAMQCQRDAAAIVDCFTSDP